MLLQIGPRRAPEDPDLVDLLRDCHGRIRRFLIVARQLADADAANTDPGELRATAGQIRRYFTEAFPIHTTDEDELAPHLAGASPDVDRALATMTSDHVAHGALVSRLVAICARIERDARQHGAMAAELARVATILATELEAHLELEEHVIFPALRRLPAPLRDALRTEMRARRTLSLRAAT
jgi:hemerythrin-like domain-containing protein